MRLHRFFIEEKVGERKQLTLSDSKLSHQLKNVFRYGPGDNIVVLDNSGGEFLAEIIKIEKRFIVLNNLHQTNSDVVLKNKKTLTMYCSIVKKDSFEFIAEKCTELGITKIVPLISERSEKKTVNRERILKILKEASEQSGRLVLPILNETLLLNEAITHSFTTFTEKNSLALPPLVLDPYADEKLFDYIKEKSRLAQDESFFIGPEGGWSPEEISLFSSYNIKRLRLGDLILRAETAAIISAGILLLE